MKDLYHQDVVEMIERETRRFELWEIHSASDPAFATAYQTLWDAFGASGEMEREDAVRGFLLDDPYEPGPSGTFIRYFLIVARDRDGRLCGVRDGTVLVNPRYAPDFCVVFLSHLYMMPWARGTVLSYWLRISPVDVAVEYLGELHRRGLIRLPAPDDPGRHFGMRLDLTAEMDFFSPDDPVTWQRILFYGRGGFDVIDPRNFPYLQPDFREPELIRATGNRPHPFMMLVRRMGRERQATMAIDEAVALMRLLYDDFATHCATEHLGNSLQLVLDRLTTRERRKSYVDLFPLPTGPKDLHRLKRLFRADVFRRNYAGASPIVDEYLARMGPLLERNPNYLDAAVDAIRFELEQRPPYVYGSRDETRAWDDTPIPEEPKRVRWGR
jgi:hypothetical protein